jgi:hypothetical protein
MAPSPKANRASKAGITHFPLRKEQESQERVPPQSQIKRVSNVEKGAVGRGHRLSRKATPKALLESEGLFEGKGGKGGKTGGSRAGLLSASRKTQKGRR